MELAKNVFITLQTFFVNHCMQKQKLKLRDFPSVEGEEEEEEELNGMERDAKIAFLFAESGYWTIVSRYIAQSEEIVTYISPSKNKTLLHIAAAQASIEGTAIVMNVLKNLSKKEDKMGLVNSKDSDGNTPLGNLLSEENPLRIISTAVEMPSDPPGLNSRILRIAHVLLEHGRNLANEPIYYNGKSASPLQVVLEKYLPPLVTLLTAFGAEVDKVDTDNTKVLYARSAALFYLYNGKKLDESEMRDLSDAQSVFEIVSTLRRKAESMALSRFFYYALGSAAKEAKEEFPELGKFTRKKRENLRNKRGVYWKKISEQLEEKDVSFEEYLTEVLNRSAIGLLYRGTVYDFLRNYIDKIYKPTVYDKLVWNLLH